MKKINLLVLGAGLLTMLNAAWAADTNLNTQSCTYLSKGVWQQMDSHSKGPFAIEFTANRGQSGTYSVTMTDKLSPVKEIFMADCTDNTVTFKSKDGYLQGCTGTLVSDADNYTLIISDCSRKYTHRIEGIYSSN